MVLKFWNNDTTVNSTVDYVAPPNNLYDLELLKQYRPQVTTIVPSSSCVPCGRYCLSNSRS